MNKKYFIVSLIVVVLILLIALFINSKEEVYSTITLDINPSIEININKNEELISIKALNDDAKGIVDNSLKGKSLSEVFKSISKKLIENNYVTDGNVVMLVNSSRNMDYEVLKETIVRSFKENDISVDVITVSKVTEDDKKYAKEHNITPYKAAYINSIKEEVENVDIEYLTDKSINEIKSVKDNIKKCDEGYFKEGNSCLKEIERIPATSGRVCPSGYLEYNGKCYEESGAIEGNNITCREDFTLKDDMCVKESSYLAEVDCADGHFLEEQGLCEIRIVVADAYEFCRDPGRTLYNHKCLATKPTINGGCLNGDMLYNGKCVNTRNDYYEAEWKCPNGEVITNDKGELLDSDTKCREWQKVQPVRFKDCEEGFELSGRMCKKIEKENPIRDSYCQENYTKIENGRCINLNNTKDFESGFICDRENSRVMGNECVIYEIIEAK